MSGDDEKQKENLESLAKADPSYKKTVSYQKTMSKLSGGDNDSSSSRSSSSSSTLTPFEQIESGTGPIGEAHKAVTTQRSFSSTREVHDVATGKVAPRQPSVIQGQHTTVLASGVESGAVQKVQIGGYEYDYNPASGEITRYTDEGTPITRKLYQENVASYVLGEALERGYVRENVYRDDSGQLYYTYSFREGTPANIKTAIKGRIQETGYNLEESPIDKQLVFTKREFGTTDDKPIMQALSKSGSQPEGSGKTLFDFTTNTYTDTKTGEQYSYGKHNMQTNLQAEEKTVFDFSKNTETNLRTGEVVQLNKPTTKFYDTSKGSSGGGFRKQSTASEWVSAQDIVMPVLAGSLYVPRDDTKEGRMLNRIAAKYESEGVTFESVSHDLGQRFSWTERVKTGVTRWGGYSQEVTGLPTNVSTVLGGTSYFALQSGYLFADTAFTTVMIGKGFGAAGTVESTVAKEGLRSGLQKLGTNALRGAARITGSGTYLATGLIKQIPAEQKLQIAEVTGGLLLASAGARAAGIVSDKTPIGGVGQGVIDVGEKFTRYVTLRSKPGEREDIVISATVFNAPYYGAKIANVRPTGKASQIIEGVYKGANVAAAGLIGYRNVEQVERETGRRDYARALGRTAGEIGIFEYAFEQKTIDTMFERSGVHKAAQAKVAALKQTGAIKPEYDIYWSGVDAEPTIRLQGSSRATADIKYEGAQKLEGGVQMPGFNVKQGLSADINARVVAAPDWMADIRLDTTQKPSPRVELDTKQDIRPDTRLDTKLEEHLTGRIDLRPSERIDIRPDDRMFHLDLKFDNKLDTRLDLRPDTRPDIKPDTPVDIRPDFRPDEDTDNRFDNRNDIKIDNRLSIFDPAIVGAAFLPFLGTGAGGTGSRGIGKRSKVPGKAQDLLSVFLGETAQPPKKNPVETQPQPPKAQSKQLLFDPFRDIDIFGKKKKRR